MHDTDAEVERRREAEARQKYGRGQRVRTKSIRDKKLRETLKRVEEKNKKAILAARDAEILQEHDAGFLEPEGEIERTYKVKQDEIQRSVSTETGKKGFKLDLPMGPYLAEYTRNGKELLLASKTGHVATMEWRNGRLGCEINLKEMVRDVKWLHNNQSFAVSQKDCVYIYDRQGVEIHKLKKQHEVSHMEFLPYHFLLCTTNPKGHLKYVDTSIGHIVSEISTHLGPTTAMCQNPWNAILHMGHGKGQITLWSPNSSTALARIQAHRSSSPINTVAVDRAGKYMVSGAQDGTLSVWDIRNYKRPVDSDYFTHRPASSVAISDKGLVAVGWGTQVSIWRDIFGKMKIKNPYMSWGGEGQSVSRIRWCPFEDILGIGHSAGFSSAIVPGAGEPNFDALEVNPYENVKQRQETEVRSLLNKLQPEMISLEPDFIGNLDLASAEQRARERDLDRKPDDIVAKLTKKARGRNSALKKHMRKKGQQNVITYDKLRLQDAIQANNAKAKENKERELERYGPALAKFATNGK
ncbi:putative small nucleolar ribonucleoprotein complex subunit [Pseudovirgaria hyperparasitica]|uniref:U three protein 7 n=1 Tax=Pseudovirgaria hyperparasitica TaxID=470096 RepID=A0A6A6WIY2_9PEZI|nr:putative small nucleolar ribonucleoprotein complex subunit [Pseudovirgaria hyperparasitica]KAF2762309.1 putative small nucleolar ribonucleoprotein complex subunit [Pseudovirgaria hyperparasitica]